MTKLAIIGGSDAYKRIASNSLGKIERIADIETPFGKGSPVYMVDKPDQPYYFISRHGETGYNVAASFVNYKANIWSLKMLNVERIISWSGPGIINRSFKVGSFSVPDDIIDFTKSRESTFFKKRGLGFIRFKDTFCPDLRHCLIYSLEKRNLEFKDHGVYICTEGPRLETPAEIRMFEKYGADLVGMTLAPEAFLARELEICYGSICYLTNMAESVSFRDYSKGELFEGMLTDNEKEKVEDASAILPEIIYDALLLISNTKRTCDCKDAMLRYKKNKIISDDFREWIK